MGLNGWNRRLRPVQNFGASTLALAALGAAAGCGSGGGPSAVAGGGSGGKCNGQAETAAMQRYVTSGRVLGTGPYGAQPAPASDVRLTPGEIATVKAKHATAAIVMHFEGDDWSNAQVAGLRSEFSKLGIKVIAQTSADAKVTKQFSDIETATALKPTIMVSIPSLDVKTLAPAYRKAAQAGIKIVFMDNPAQGMRPGRDYVAVAAADYYGFGVLTAHQMAKALCGKGTIGVLYHAAKAPNNVQSLNGFTETIKKDYPDIKIVASGGLLGPDFSGQGESNVSAMLTRHPNLSGVWCFFDLPCEGAINAARSAGRNNLVLTMGGLGKNVATYMASGEFVAGIGSVQPYEQGVVEARLAAYGLLGKQAPPYVELPALPVDRANLLTSWKEIYGASAPTPVERALKATR